MYNLPNPTQKEGVEGEQEGTVLLSVSSPNKWHRHTPNQEHIQQSNMLINTSHQIGTLTGPSNSSQKEILRHTSERGQR